MTSDLDGIESRLFPAILLVLEKPVCPLCMTLYIYREQTGFSKTNRMAVNRLEDHTGGKKHSAKVR